MANTLLTLNNITREAVTLWKNTNKFIQNIDMQYDNTFAKTGAKQGTQLRIRLPNDYTVRSGAAASVQDTSEQSETLVVATQLGVDVSFNTVDRTMSLDDYSTRVIGPAVNNLAGSVASTIMGGAEAGVSNFVANTDANGNIISPNANTFLTAAAVLNANSTPDSRRKMVLDPYTNARAVATLSGLLNPQQQLSEQYKSGNMTNSLGFDFYWDQTVIKHASGTYSAGSVNGAGQTGTTLMVNAITGTLNVGDIITIANVNSVNRITKQTTGMLRQFVITQAAASGATQLPIYPALVAPIGGQQVQYQTVDSSPANAAAILMVNPASSIFRKNIGYAPEGITMACADLYLPTSGIIEGARESFDGVSMRMITDYMIGTDQVITRLDILFGFLFVRPDWCVTVADSI